MLNKDTHLYQGELSPRSSETVFFLHAFVDFVSSVVYASPASIAAKVISAAGLPVRSFQA